MHIHAYVCTQEKKQPCLESIKNKTLYRMRDAMIFAFDSDK